MNVYISLEDERFIYLKELMKDKFNIVNDVSEADIIILGIKESCVPKCTKRDSLIVSYHAVNFSNNLVLSDSDKFLLKNAQLTAVACIQKLNLTNKNVVIYGNGRIASFLKKYIYQCHVICRHPKNDEYPLTSKLYQDADVIINTIPCHLPIDVSSLKKDIKIIDLASAPYGFCHDKLIDLGIDIELWSGLPAKCFPLESAYLIYEEVMECLKEKELV